MTNKNKFFTSFFSMLAILIFAVSSVSAASSTPLYLKNKSYQMQFKNQSNYQPKHFDVVMLGDSITFNVQWAELLSASSVANRGINGDYTEGMMNRLQYVTNLTPKLVFIMAGTNDLQWNVATPEKAFANYKVIISKLQDAGITPVITSTLFASPYLSTYKTGNARIKKLDSYLSKYAKEIGITYIDLNETLAPNGVLLNKYTVDGIHLNGDGYSIWSKKINAVIEEKLQ